MESGGKSSRNKMHLEPLIARLQYKFAWKEQHSSFKKAEKQTTLM